MTREQRYGIRSLKRDFPDDNSVLEFMFDALHSRKCSCGGTYSMVTGRRQFYCSKCRFQIAPVSETIMYRTAIPLNVWFKALLLFNQSRSIRSVANELGYGYKTIWRIHKLLNSAASNDTIDLCLTPKNICVNTTVNTTQKTRTLNESTTDSTRQKTVRSTGKPLAPITPTYGLKFLKCIPTEKLSVLVAESKRLSSWALTT